MAGSTDKIQQLQHVSLADGAQNTLIGLNSGTMAADRGRWNTALGANACTLAAGLDSAVAVGVQAGESATLVANVVAVGAAAMQAAYAVYDTVAVGGETARVLQRAADDTFVGFRAGAQLGSAVRTVAVGAYAAYRGTTLANGTFLGAYAGFETQGADNVFVGCAAGSAANVSGSVIIGAGAGQNATGANLVIIGRSGNGATAGNGCTVLGIDAGSDARGDFGTDIGFAAGQNWIGDQATFVGARAGQLVGVGNLATGLGYGALGAGARASNVVAVGAYAGEAWVGDGGAFVGPYAGATGSGNAAVVVGSNIALLTAENAVIVGAGLRAANAQALVAIGTGVDASLVRTGVFLGSDFQAQPSDDAGLVVATQSQRVMSAGQGAISLGDLADPYLYANGASLHLGQAASRVLQVDAGALTAFLPGLTSFFQAGSDGLFYVGAAGTSARSIAANNSSLLMGSNADDPFFYASNDGTVQVGQTAEIALFSNPRRLFLGSANDPYFFANSDGIVQVGQAAEVALYSDPWHLYLGSANDPYFFASNAGQLLVGQGAHAALYSSPAVLQLGNELDPYFYASVLGYVTVGQTAARALASNATQLSLGSDADPYFFASGAGAGTLYLGQAATRVLQVDAGEVTALLPGLGAFFSANSGGGGAIGPGAARALTTTPTTLALGSPSDPYFFASNAGTVQVGQTAHVALFSDARQLYLGSSNDPFFEATLDGAVTVGQAAARALTANSAWLALGNTADPYFMANAAGDVRIGDAANPVVAYANTYVLLGSRSDPYLLANTAGDVLLGQAASRALTSNARQLALGSPTDPYFLADAGGTLYLGQAATRVLQVDAGALTAFLPGLTSFFQAGSDGLFYVGAAGTSARSIAANNSSLLMGSNADDPFFYASNDGTVQVGQTSEIALFSNTRRLFLGSANDPYFAATTGNSIAVGQSASRAVYAYNDSSGYGMVIGPTANPFMQAFATPSSGSFALGGTQPYFAANLIGTSAYTLSLGTQGTAMQVLSLGTSNVFTIGPPSNPILHAFDSPEATLELGGGSALFANATLFQAGSDAHALAAAPYPAVPPNTTFSSDTYVTSGAPVPGIPNAPPYGAGTYTFSASSTDYAAYLAFLPKLGPVQPIWESTYNYNWASNIDPYMLIYAYAGNATTTVSYWNTSTPSTYATNVAVAGEYVQMDTPAPFVASSVAFTAVAPLVGGTVWVAASNSSAGPWTAIAGPGVASQPNTGLYSFAAMPSLSVNPNASFSSYRIIFNALTSNDPYYISSGLAVFVGSANVTTMVEVPQPIISASNNLLTLGLYTNRFLTAQPGSVTLGPASGPYASFSASGIGSGKTAVCADFHAQGYAANTGVQGAYLQWNNSGGGGETDFVNQKGLGAGGWSWQDRDSNGNLILQCAYLDATGNFTLDYGVLNFGARNQNNLICLWGDTTAPNPPATGWYGFGVNPGSLRYQADGSAAHEWYSGATLTACLDSYGQMYATGGFYTGSVHGIFNQGAYLQWNRLTGTGETDFINQKGGGYGGWYWLDFGNQNNLLTQSAYLTAAGNFVIAGGGTAPGGWATGSDARAKEDVRDADLDACYRAVKALRLHRFRWTAAYYPDTVHDRQQIGWLAHEVAQVFPKAVSAIAANCCGIDDFAVVNPDQIHKAVHGALQKVIADKEALEARVAALEARVAALSTG